MVLRLVTSISTLVESSKVSLKVVLPVPVTTPLETGLPPPTILTVATPPLRLTDDTPAPVKFIVLPLPTVDPFLWKSISLEFLFASPLI